LIFVHLNNDWINIISKFGHLNDFEQENITKQILLRLNYNIVGTKFCIDSKSNIYCNAEVFYNSLNSEYLKRILVQIVNAISLFYQEIIKKQN